MTVVRCAILVGFVGGALLLSGCTKERAPRPEPAAAESAPSGEDKVVAEAAPVTPAPGEPKVAPAPEAPRAHAPPKVMEITAAEFEEIVKAVRVCEITPRGISRECEPYQAYRYAKRRRGAIDRRWRVVDREVATRLLAHEDAAVRFVAAELMGPMFKATEDQLGPLMEATRREVHPGVVKSFAKRLGPSTYLNEEVRELMMILGGHLDEAVRIEVASWLTSVRGRGTPKILQRAMKMAREDPAERVRLRTIEDLGDQADNVVLPFLERYLKAPEKSERAYASAVRALINMWSCPIPQPEPSKAAYLRTMRLLEKTPRSAITPPWTALSGLKWVRDERFITRAPWFDAARFHKALDAIVVDRDAGVKVRKAIVELLIVFKIERARFVKLLAAYPSASDGPPVADEAPVVELLRSAADPNAPPPSTTAPAVPNLPIPAMPKFRVPPAPSTP